MVFVKGREAAADTDDKRRQLPPWTRIVDQGNTVGKCMVTQPESIRQPLSAVPWRAARSSARATCPGRLTPNHMVFVLSLCDGIGAIFDAVEYFTAKIDGLVCEKDANLRALARRRWPGLAVWENATTLTVDKIDPLLSAKSYDLVLLVGAPPCPPLSALPSGVKSFASERTMPLQGFMRIRNELSAWCQLRGVWFEWMLEEVASMSQAHREEITSMAGSPPVLIHAADFGWVHRPRLFWGCQERSLSPVTALRTRDVELAPAGKLAKGLAVVRWTGKPWPAKFTPELVSPGSTVMRLGEKVCWQPELGIRRHTLWGVSCLSPQPGLTRLIALPDRAVMTDMSSSVSWMMADFALFPITFGATCLPRAQHSGPCPRARKRC